MKPSFARRIWSRVVRFWDSLFLCCESGWSRLIDPKGKTSHKKLSTSLTFEALENRDVMTAVSLTQSSFSVVENQLTALISVQVDAAPSQPVSVQYRTIADSALSGQDFMTTLGTLTFGPGGPLMQSFSVSILDDFNAEALEKFQVELFNPTGGLTLGAVFQADVSITDNDPPSFSFGALTFSVAEGNAATITMQRTGSLTQTAQVTFATGNSWDTATAGTDYVGITGQTVTFDVGQAAATIQVHTLNDSLQEPVELVSLKLLNPSLGYVIQNNLATLSIQNASPGAFSFAMGSFSAPEGSPATISLSRTGDLTQSATVRISTGSPSDSATANLDYSALNGQMVTFAPNQSLATVVIQTNADSLAESTESLTLTLSDPSINYTIPWTTSTLFISDVPPPIVGTFSFQSLNWAVPEGSAILVGIHRSGAIDQAASVTFSTGGLTDTATAGMDYTHLTQIVSFAPGQTDATVQVQTLADNLQENTEIVSLKLANPSASFAIQNNVAFLQIEQPVQPETITWTGNGDGSSFNDAANWDLFHTPTLHSNVIIGPGAQVLIHPDQIVEIRSLNSLGDIDNRGNLILHNNSTAAGTFTSTGQLTLVSDANLEVSGPANLAGAVMLKDGAQLTLNGIVNLEDLNVTSSGPLANGLMLLHGPTVTVQGAVFVDQVQFSGGGDLTGTGVLTIRGAMTWFSGALVNLELEISATGQLFIANGDAKVISGATITNHGYAFFSSDQAVVVDNGTFINQGLFNFHAAGNFQLPVGQQQGGLTFENHGTVIRDTDENPTLFAGDFDNQGVLVVEAGDLRFSGDHFQNSGQIRVAEGVLNILAQGVSTGSFLVEEGGILRFQADMLPENQRIILAASSSVLGSGTVNFAGDPGTWTNGVTIIRGAYDVQSTLIAWKAIFEREGLEQSGAPQIFRSAYTLLQNGGILETRGNVNYEATSLFLWTGGALDGGWPTASQRGLVIAATARLSVVGQVSWHTGFDLTNLGTMEIKEAGLIVLESDPGSIRLYNQGTLDILTDQPFLSNTLGLNIVNSGILRKQLDLNNGLGQGDTVLNNLALTNSGAIEVQVGSLILRGQGSFAQSASPAGYFVTVGAGARLVFAGDFTLESNTNFFGPGVVEVAAGVFTIAHSMTASQVELSGGSINGLQGIGFTSLTAYQKFTWTGGALKANLNIPTTGTLFVSNSGPAPLVLNGLIYNDGTSAWAGQVRIVLAELSVGWLGLPMESPFTNPANPFFDSQTGKDAWNALLNALKSPNVPGQTNQSALAVYLADEENAAAAYEVIVNDNDPNGLAMIYQAAYAQAQQNYQTALQTAAQADPTQATDAYWDAVAQAEETFDQAIESAADQMVQAERSAYQTYAAAGQAGYQAEVAAALNSYQQAALAARVSGKVPITVEQAYNLLHPAQGQPQDLSPHFIGVAAEARASFLLEYYLRYGEMLPYTGSLVQGSAPPNPGNNGSMLDNLEAFFTDVKNAFQSIDVGAVWDNVAQFFDNSVQFLGNVAHQLVTNPLGLLQDVTQGVRDATVVLVNTFTFGGIPALNAEATQLVKNNGGFLRALQVVGTFARELGITYLTMGVGRLATQVGVNTLGRVATGLGLSQAAQTQLLCRLYTIDRLMAPLRAYEQLNSLATNFNRARLAAQRGDYEGAAALLGRSVLTVPAAVTSLRETTRLGAGVVSLAVNGNAQVLNDYLQACFAAGTPILGEHGEKPIEEFQPGDRVWCRDEKNPDGFIELRPIEEVFSSANPIWHVHVGGQVIRTTAEHPFWVVGQGWTPARELHPGLLLLSHDGQTKQIEEILETGQWEKVYNFRVTEHHTYFVGRADWGFSVWAHNANLCFQVVRRTGLQAPNQNIVVTNAQGQRIQVWGEPQHVFLGNGTETDHAQRIMQALPDLARTAPDGSYFVLNRSWRTATNRLFESANRPDIILVSPLANGKFKISAWEVRSPSDPPDLVARLQQGWNSFVGDFTEINQGNLMVWGED